MWHWVWSFVLFLVVVVCLAQPLYAQKNVRTSQHNLNQFSTEQGLSQGNVYQVLKDQDGFVWIATEDGLNRFDGYDFNIFKHDDLDSTSISDNIIWCMTEDAKGVLWIGTNQGGLCRYDKERGNFKSYVNDENKPNSLSQNTVQTIFEASDGKLWVGTHWGLNVFDRHTEKFETFYASSEGRKGLLHNRINAIMETPAHELWIGTAMGISIFSLDGHFIRNIKGSQMPSGNVSNLLLTPSGE